MGGGCFLSLFILQESGYRTGPNDTTCRSVNEAPNAGCARHPVADGLPRNWLRLTRQPWARNTEMMEQWNPGVSLGDWVRLASMAPPCSLTSFSARAQSRTFGAIGFVSHDPSFNRLPTTDWLCFAPSPLARRQVRAIPARLCRDDARRRRTLGVPPPSSMGVPPMILTSGRNARATWHAPNWLCFSQPLGSRIAHNCRAAQDLSRIRLRANWVCFAQLAHRRARSDAARRFFVARASPPDFLGTGRGLAHRFLPRHKTAAAANWVRFA